MDGIIKVVNMEVENDDLRCKLYMGFIKVLEERGWKTSYACIGQDRSYENAYFSLHPSTEG